MGQQGAGESSVWRTANAVREQSRKQLSFIGRLTLVLVTATASSSSAAPPPRFGGEVIGVNAYGYLTSAGANLYRISGAGVAWSRLMPDGVNFDANALTALDRDVRNAFNANVGQMILTIIPGGGTYVPFSGPKSGWPIDTTTYSIKDGELLGAQVSATLLSFPPKILTLDTPGNTSPWYEFVKALATRYNGATPDPLDGSKMLPRVDFWSCVEEPEMKSSWYGTSKDFYGGVGGNAAVGVQPSFHRAVKAANPLSKVIAGGLSSQEVGLYLVHEMARAHGNTYDAAVRDWGVRYFHTNWPLQQVLTVPISDADLFANFETDPTRVQSRLMIDRLFAATSDDFYDVVGMHSLDSWEMTPDLIDFYRQRMLAPKPLWITELGFVDSPPPEDETLVSQEDQAVWLVKKLVLGLADGVEQMSYSPVFALRGYAEIYPTLSSERLARRSFQLVGRALNEAGGYAYDSSFASGGTEFHVFDRSDGVSHLAIAWRADGSLAQDARALLGVPGGATVRVLDHLEHVVSTGDLNLTFSTEPLAIFWSTATLDGDADGVPRPVDCDDADSAVSPDLPENPNDFKDNDCNPVTPAGSGCSAIASASSTGESIPADAAAVLVALAAIAGSRRRASRRRGSSATG